MWTSETAAPPTLAEGERRARRRQHAFRQLLQDRSPQQFRALLAGDGEHAAGDLHTISPSTVRVLACEDWNNEANAGDAPEFTAARRVLSRQRLRALVGRGGVRVR